jgi:hypothetical protein
MDTYDKEPCSRIPYRAEANVFHSLNQVGHHILFSLLRPSEYYISFAVLVIV